MNPKNTTTEIEGVNSRSTTLSPVIYLAVGALVGGVSAIVVFGVQNPHNFWASVAGWIVGGYVYRLRSQEWKIDPNVIRKQSAVLGYIALLGFVLVFQALSEIARTVELLGIFGGCALGILLVGHKRRD